MVTESMDGKPVAPLMGGIGDYSSGVFAIVALPNLLLEANPDYVMTLRIAPAAPRLTVAEVSWLVQADAREGVDYDLDRLTEFWRLTSEQDWKLCENNQRGVNSRYYRPGPYAPDEGGVEQFVDWYVKRVAEPGS
jgi:Rieske 2Fe-2S family protein